MAKRDGLWRRGYVGGVAIAVAADQEAGATLPITSDFPQPDSTAS